MENNLQTQRGDMKAELKKKRRSSTKLSILFVNYLQPIIKAIEEDRTILELLLDVLEFEPGWQDVASEIETVRVSEIAEDSIIPEIIDKAGLIIDRFQDNISKLRVKMTSLTSKLRYRRQATRKASSSFQFILKLLVRWSAWAKEIKDKQCAMTTPHLATGCAGASSGVDHQTDQVPILPRDDKPVMDSDNSDLDSERSVVVSEKSAIDSCDSVMDSENSFVESDKSVVNSVMDSGDSFVVSTNSVLDTDIFVVDSGDSVVDSDKSVKESGDSVMDSGDSVVDSGKSVMESGDSVMDSGDSVVDSGVSVMNSGDSSVDSCDSVVDSGVSVMNSGDSVVDSGKKAHEEWDCKKIEQIRTNLMNILFKYTVLLDLLDEII